MTKIKKSPQYYTCPMHPEVRRDRPGICPECGMNLIPVLERKEEEEYDKHAGHKTEVFLKKFFVSLILTIVVLVFSFGIVTFAGIQYLILVLSSIIFFYGGFIFLKGALYELKARLPGMMTLIALAILTAYLYSIFAILSAMGKTLFWELSTLITIMLLGHYLEMRAVSGAQKALKEISKLLPDTAEVIHKEKTKVIPLSELKVGDIVLARPGAKIPADGVVVEGKSDVNEAMITGESKPVPKVAGSETIAGTINGDGLLKIRVSKIGENTFLAGVMRLVAEAQASKSRLQMLSDRAAYYLTLIAITAGTATLITWLLLSGAGFAFALERLVAVLVIACPHALGLAVPLVASISTTLAAKHGFLVRQRLALESARKIDVVMFDKTGTLTFGEYGVSKIFAVSELPEKVLELAAGVDSFSEHFIAKAIVRKAREEKISFLEAKNFKRLAGKGVKGIVEGKEIFVGGENLLKDFDLKIPEKIRNEVEEENKQGKTIIYVISENKILGVFTLADLIRKESREAIESLKAMGIKTAMITGDSQNAARFVAENLGIDEVFAEVLPQEKAEKVKALQEKGLKTGMVGDGINDAPALTQADLGIAIGAGTNVAIESAGIILVRNDPRDIAKIIRLSRLTYRKMLQNLFWATGYNIIAIPLAAGVLAYKGVLLQPALAALFMSLSTVIVAVNAIFLKNAKLD